MDVKSVWWQESEGVPNLMVCNFSLKDLAQSFVENKGERTVELKI